jgi:hypothetical protein
MLSTSYGNGPSNYFEVENVYNNAYFFRRHWLIFIIIVIVIDLNNYWTYWIIAYLLTVPRNGIYILQASLNLKSL